ncbi:MAG: hypothetical protein AUH69_06500 [Actinobacteria bacterium 13_1_40CM_4_65_12]|nr:MAG: hypothetical protein AUH69_06500 [Actinobacteria bacterium 13_1_40CM_4_65_12]
MAASVSSAINKAHFISTTVNGPVLEGCVELEIRPEDRAEHAVRDCVVAGLDALMKAPKAPKIAVLETKG